MIETLNSWGAAWSGHFGLAIVQNTVFIAVVFLALHVMRNARAGVKHTIALVGLLKLLVPPFLQLPVARLPFVASAALPVVTPISLAPLSVNPGPASTAAVVSSGGNLSFSGALLLLWLVASGSYLILSTISTFRLMWQLRDAIPVSNWPTLPRVRGRTIGVFKSDRITMPLTVGIFPRQIFVPASWDHWTEECRRFVVRHEAAHIARYDGLIQVLEIVIRSIYFFHPLVWMLTRRLATYREMTCDDITVCSCGRSPVAYSSYLVEIAESLPVRPVECRSAAALLKHRHELLDRVRYQVKEGKMTTMSKRARRFILIGLLMLSVPLSWYCGRAETEVADTALEHDSKSAKTTQTSGSHSWEYIEVVITSDTDVMMDGEAVALGDLESKLKAEARGGADEKVIVIRCGDGVKMSTLSEVQAKMVDAGLRKVSYQNARGDALALILPGDKEKRLLDSIDPEDIVTIHVGPGTKIAMSGRQVGIEQLEDMVRKHLTLNPHVVISIKTSDDAGYVDFHTVLDKVKAAGATRIAVG